LAEPDQYLRLSFAGVEFLLPSTSSLAIEQRENLEVNANQESGVAAYRVTSTGKWPALCLNNELRISHNPSWLRSVFIGNASEAYGITVEEVQLLPRQDVEVGPFTPLGPPPTGAGHIFSGVWVRGSDVTLVFSPAGLAGYLRTLGGTG